MSSLHTKHRPKTFDEVLGQDVVVKSLRKVLKNGRGHCFLFSGSSGTGKTTLARILANELSGSNFNLLEYDGASKSGADDMRQLVSQLYYKAIGASPVKFVVIDECHKLSSSAWDVLLKPTEEPPEHVYYSFCTTNVSKVPKAIITRCLRYDLKPVKEELILELLCRVSDEEQLSTSDEILEAIAENSSGSPRQALVFLEACAECKSAAEARVLMRDADGTGDAAGLARWLVGGKALNWRDACKHVKAMEGQEAESIRIVVSNYVAAVLINTTDAKRAAFLLKILDCFKEPYMPSDKMAPLLLSLGYVLEMDR